MQIYVCATLPRMFSTFYLNGFMSDQIFIANVSSIPLFHVFLYSFVLLLQILISTERKRERERERERGGGGGERAGSFCKHHCHITLIDKIHLLQLSFQTLLKNIYEKKFDKSGLEII